MTLNGPQGHVSAKTVASVKMIEWGLQRLLVKVSEFDYKAINLLSCMTLDVEICHSTVYITQVNLSMLEYCRSLGLKVRNRLREQLNGRPLTIPAEGHGIPSQRRQYRFPGYPP